MKKKALKTEYKAPRFKEIILYLCEKNSLPFDTVVGDILEKFPELLKKEVCANCGASMKIYTDKVDIHNCLLMQSVGREVKKRLAAGMSFTEANKVRVSRLAGQTYAVSSRMSQCGKLGLIAKIKNEDGTHNRDEGWAITRRGYDLLGGLPVPEYAHVHRNQIVEREEDVPKITINEVFEKYKTTTMSRARRGMSYNKSHVEAVTTYDPQEWFEVFGLASGKII